VSALALLAILALLLVPSTAGAQCEGPPGEAGIDEYCETIPGPGGDEGTGGRGDGGGGSGGSGGETPSGAPIPSDTTSALEQSGSDGQGLLAFADSGAGNRSAKNDDGGGGAATIAPRASEPPQGTLGAVGSAVDSAPMSEGGLVLVLVAIALGLSAVALYRRRSAGGP